MTASLYDTWKNGLATWSPSDLNGYGASYADQFKKAWTDYVNTLSAPSKDPTGAPKTYGTYGGVKLEGSAATNPAIAMYQKLQNQYNAAAEADATRSKLSSGWTAKQNPNTGKYTDWVAPNGATRSILGGWGRWTGGNDWKNDRNIFGQSRPNPYIAAGYPGSTKTPPVSQPPAQQPRNQPPAGGNGTGWNQQPPSGGGVPPGGIPATPAASPYVGMPKTGPVGQPGGSPQGVPAWWLAMMANKPSMQQAQAQALRGGAV